MKIRSHPEPVARVREILDLVVLKNSPPTLFVRASGVVATTGRANGSLVPRIYSEPPEDLIQEFDFVADAARDFVLQVESEIIGEGVLHSLPNWAVGIRIMAQGNQLAQMFPNTSEPLTDEITETESAKQHIGILPPHSHASAQSLLVTKSEGYARTPWHQERHAEFVLGSVSIPDVKTVSETRCLLRDPTTGATVLEKEMPVVYRRVVRQRLLARVHFGEEAPDEKRLRDCVQNAVAEGIAIDVLVSGDLTIAAAALQFELRKMGRFSHGLAADNILVELRREAMPGPWKKI